jgi:SEC-C motif
MVKKVGRNDPCPCNSGMKYKKCHGSIDRLDQMASLMAQFPLMRARVNADQAQRQRQQGLGKPIISTEVQGHRVVAVRNRIHTSKNWKTFHDFLLDYIKIVIGGEWGNAEIAKPFEERHPVLQWYQKICDYQRTFIAEQGKVSTAPMTGAVSAYMHLSYDLYALDHAVEVQDLLLVRLRNRDNFEGARYEVRVAATLLRAGFDLELEDEQDSSTTHVEFTATHKRTGKKFSVEAKQRESDRIRINRLLYRALKKNAKHARIVFTDINEPDSNADEMPPKFMRHAEDKMRAYERDAQGKLLPPAYIIVTNTPWHFSLENNNHRCSALVHGFKFPELQAGYAFQSIRAAVDSRDAHIELYDLMKSLKEHTDIPSTFDGELPEFAFDSSEGRLVVGQRYSMPDNKGVLHEGVLESAVVMEPESQAWCVLKLDDSRRIICTSPLSELEVRAWRKHPDTFFGVLDPNVKRVMGSPVDWYDFFYGSYKDTPKPKLLEFFAGAPDYPQLEALNQAELARVYAERLANRVVLDEQRKQTSKPDP